MITPIKKSYNPCNLLIICVLNRLLTFSAYTLFTFLFFFSSCFSSGDYSHIKVVEVIDGDTVRLADGKLLRYIGIDTPETKIKKNDKFIASPQPFSIDAKEYNRLLVEGKIVKIEFDVQTADKYGRLLGYCFINEIFVNAKILEEGLAVINTIPPNVRYVDLFIKLQRQAREKKKGLWGNYEVISHKDAHSYINQIRTVRGKVKNVYKSSKCIFLNFGSNYKKDFTVVIFKNSWKEFLNKNVDLLTAYKGKMIEVSGRIREYNGPEIIVNTPGDIEIVEEKLNN